MLPFARMLEYGNVPDYGFRGIFGEVPAAGGYSVQAQNRAFSTSSGTKIYTLGGDTGSGYSGELLEYDPVLNSYKLIHAAPNTSLPCSICYVGGYVYILNYPNTSITTIRRVNVSTGVNEDLGTSSISGWTTGLVSNPYGTVLYTINRNTYRLQSYSIDSGKWGTQGTASFGTYTSDSILSDSDGYIYMLGESVFKRMDIYGSNVVNLKVPNVHPPFSGFYSSLFKIDNDIYAYSYGILQKYSISTDTWTYISDAAPVLGSLTTNAIGCYNSGTNSMYLFYAVVGPGAKGTKIGRIY